MFSKEHWYHNCYVTAKNGRLDTDGIDVVLVTSHGDIYIQVKSGHSGGRSANYYTGRGILLIRVCYLSPENLKKKILSTVKEGLNSKKFTFNRRIYSIASEKQKHFEQAVLVYEKGFAYLIKPESFEDIFNRAVKDKERQFENFVSNIYLPPVSSPRDMVKTISFKKRSGITPKPVKFRIDKCFMDIGGYRLVKTEVRDVIENLPPPLPNGRAVPEPKVIAEVLTIPKTNKNRSSKAKPKYFINSAGQLEAYKF